MRRWAAAVLVAVALAAGACGSDDSSDDGQLSLTYELDKECARANEQQSLISHTESGVEIAYAIIYADSRIRGEAPRGRTDDDGNFGARWQVPGDAPAGPVKVRILAVKGSETANVVAEFHVANDQVPCP